MKKVLFAIEVLDILNGALKSNDVQRSLRICLFWNAALWEMGTNFIRNRVK